MCESGYASNIFHIFYIEFYLGKISRKWNQISIVQEGKGLTPETLLATLNKIHKEYEIKFSLLLTSIQKDMHVVKLVAEEVHETFYINVVDGLLQITLSDNHNLSSYTAFQSKQWILVEIRQVKDEMGYTFSIYINGTNVYSESNVHPREFNDVNIYVGDSSVKDFGVIKNMSISGKNITFIILCITMLPK